MHFMIYAVDKPNSFAIRQATREAHLEYVSQSGRKQFAAPLLDDNEMMKGSLILIEARNLLEAQEFVENDPYNQAGLFESIVIERYKNP